MKRIFAATIALAALSACGDGNPFGAAAEDDEIESETPDQVRGNLSDFSYNAAAETLTITGLLRDGDTNPVTFNRNAALDRGDYQAFTLQDDPLDQHTTVFVRSLGSVEGAVAATGGQFTYYTGGAEFRRSGGFDPVTPNEGADRGLVTYAGEYVGLANIDGPEDDLLAIPANNPVTNASVLPSTAAVVSGDIFINVEFDRNSVAGEVFNRDVDTSAGADLAVADLILVPTTLASDGTFTGNVELEGDRASLGQYSGVLGGTDSDALAGGLFANEHFGDDGALGGVTNEEEYGVFVLGRCGTANAAGVDACNGVESE